MKQRIKIYLTKYDSDNQLSENEMIKYDEGDVRFPNMCPLDDEYSTILYYKDSISRVPKWYSEYLGQPDSLVTNSYSEGLFFRKIEYNDKEYLFAISFGNAGTWLVRENLVSRFGLVTALNKCSKIFSVKKSSIGTSLSNMKEDATKGQDINEFSFDVDLDLLRSVTVIPNEYDLSIGKITGDDYLSFTTEYTYDELNQLLCECLTEYEKDSYKVKYGFVDNIIEAKKDDPNRDSVNQIVLKALSEKDEGVIWFAPTDIVEWDRITGFSLYQGRLTESNRESKLYDVDDLNLDTVSKYISSKGIEVERIEDLRKHKVLVNRDESVVDETWRLFDCMYASVKMSNAQYVINNGKMYIVNQEFYTDYESQYRNLDILPSLPKIKGNQSEAEYNEEICKTTNQLILLDKNLIREKRRIFEVCDIYDTSNNTFIHVKKYGSSSVLSHLFAQANVSSILFKDSFFNNKICEKINEVEPTIDISSLNSEDCSVVLAITTKKPIPEDLYVNIPFFSKINAVTTINYIKNQLGYSNAGLMFIETE